MSTFTPAEVISQELAQAAALVGTIELLTELNHVVINASRSDSSATQIEIHDCTPEQLEQVLALWPEAVQRKDADAILRWAEIGLAGFAVTFFRR